MKSSQIISKARTFLLGKFIDNKRNRNARRIKAFKLGFRYRMITDNDEKLLSNLLNEILKHCKDPAIARAFEEGEAHARKEKLLVEKSVEYEADQREKEQAKQKEKAEQEKMYEEVDRLLKIREENQQKEKPKTKSR